MDATQSYFVSTIVPLGLLYKLASYVTGRDAAFNYSVTSTYIQCCGYYLLVVSNLKIHFRTFYLHCVLVSFLCDYSLYAYSDMLIFDFKK